ncbi:MAG: hypothetical protein Tsb0016_07270 [Sphingomonadales bacterium]
MSLHTLTRYRHCETALRDQALKQSLYDAGAVVMKDVLLTLHGDEHRMRRQAEMRVFRRDFFKYYEHEVFPRTLEETLTPAVAAGRAELISFGYQVTVNLTADFAGIDRPEKSVEETETLLAMVKVFSEGATLVHSTRDKAAVEAEVQAALKDFAVRFQQPSIARREALLKQFAAGALTEEDLPRDVLTMLLRNEDKLDLPEDILLREMAFYMQAGAHSTSNATVHSLHEIFTWAGDDADRWARLENDPLFVQACVHESLRLHPASPEAWRRPICPAHVGDAKAVDTDDQVVLDLFQANRDREIFGDDADQFKPGRPLPKGVLPYGLTFGIGVHTCLGRELDGGVVAGAVTDPARHQYGIVASLVRRLLDLGARPDPRDPPRRDPKTSRPNWGHYPVVFTKRNSAA